jgi:WhiB family redox-sensing transcriptional regulator
MDAIEPVGGEDRDWRLESLCSQTDPEAFFPEKGGSTRPARGICRGCPVRRPCLREALLLGDRFGVRAGLPERRRRPLERQVRDLLAAGVDVERSPELEAILDAALGVETGGPSGRSSGTAA